MELVDFFSIFFLFFKKGIVHFWLESNLLRTKAFFFALLDNPILNISKALICPPSVWSSWECLLYFCRVNNSSSDKRSYEAPCLQDWVIYKSEMWASFPRKYIWIDLDRSKSPSFESYFNYTAVTRYRKLDGVISFKLVIIKMKLKNANCLASAFNN